MCCALVGCSDPPAPASDTDSGTDTGVDTGTPPVDVGTPTDMVVPVDRSCTELMTCDAGADTGVDAGSDVGVDTGVDVGVDAGVDVGVDTGVDVGVDAGVDVGVDVGVDAGPADSGTPMVPRTVMRRGGFSTLGVRAWQSGTTRIVDDEIESSGRLCSGSGAAMVCVSGGFVR
mgnify:CR=1 FL=1